MLREYARKCLLSVRRTWIYKRLRRLLGQTRAWQFFGSVLRGHYSLGRLINGVGIGEGSESLRAIVRSELLANSERKLYPQVEALISLYREIDGLTTFPKFGRWAVDPDFIVLVYDRVRNEGIQRVLECGSGSSTIALAELARAQGVDVFIDSLENNPIVYEHVVAEIERRELTDYAKIHFTPLRRYRYANLEEEFEWYNLESLPLFETYGCLIVDGPAAPNDSFARYPAGPELFHRIVPKGVIFLDDARRSGEATLPRMWRDIYPDLGVRFHETAKGAFELVDLQHHSEAWVVGSE